MFRKLAALVIVSACAGIAIAQDLSSIQVHGFVTQGLLYSSNNNYLSTNSNTGSMQWTDGAVSFGDAINDKVRVGIQLHMYQLGEFGGPQVEVDWVSGDFKPSEHLGFRVGKVKTPYGLFNDSQDVDAVFLWSLLPEPFYAPDNKSFIFPTSVAEYMAQLSSASVPEASAIAHKDLAGQLQRLVAKFKLDANRQEAAVSIS